MTELSDIVCVSMLGTGSIVLEALLSMGIFAFVVTLVLAVFGQSGAVQLSPQREVAIAGGAADRRTVFENNFLKPLLWLLLSVSHYLGLPRAKQWISRKLVAAGSPNYYTCEEYIALSMFVGLVLGGLLLVCCLLLFGQLSILLLVVGFAMGTGLTIYQLHDRASNRVRLISKRVPYSLDLIALAMGAGATFTEAVGTVVREQSDDPFNVELRAMLAEIELGTTRRQALRNLADRVPLDSLHIIVASVIQAEDLGTSLQEALRSQATLLRLHRSVNAENRAAIASVRMLIPSLLIMLSAVLAVFGPSVLRALRQGLF